MKKRISKVVNGDCMAGMADYPNGFFDLAIVDPEYGRGEHGGRNRGKMVKQRNGSSVYVSDGGYTKKDWDNKPAGEEYFKELFRVSKHQIIWGCNYYAFPFGPGRIVWDKCNEGSDQSQCELAYNSLTTRVDLFRYMWRGMMQGKSIAEGHIQQGNKRLNEKRIHPTQKPVPLYLWTLNRYAKAGWKILDTHLGSGSSRIAADISGHDFWGWETDQEYYLKQEERFTAHKRQLNIFNTL